MNSLLKNMFARIKAKYLGGLGNRILVSFVIVGTILSMIFFAVHTRNQKKEWARLYENRGRLLSAIFANMARVGVYSESEEVLKKSADAILNSPIVVGVQCYTKQDRLLFEMKKRPDVQDMLSAEMNWKSIAALNEAEKPMPVMDRETYSVFFAPVVLERQKYTEEGLYLETGDPGADYEVIGYAAVAIDRTVFSSNVRRVIAEDMVISFVFIVFGSFIIFWIIKRFTRPLGTLVNAVTVFGYDRSFRRLPVSDIDEIGRLTEAFNVMAETILARESERNKIEVRLRHAQKMEAVGTMAGGIAHDFRNILTAVIGFANIIKLELAKDHPSRQYIDHILSTSAKATKLIQGLLAYSRQQALDSRPLNVNLLMKSMEDIIKRLVQEDITVELRPADERLIITADESQMEQLILNLCTNARDAMQGGGVMTLSAGRKMLVADSFSDFSPSKPGEYAEIKVADTGTGIDPSILKRIFDPFFTTKEVGSGSGLGLSIVYGIVKQHEGYINVKSEPGKGTEVYVYLPLTGGTEARVGLTAEPAMPRGSETVLVAEDNDEVRLYIHDILKLFGYRVLEARDGDEAVRIFTEHPETGLLILDRIMPGKNGSEVFNVVRQRKPGVRTLFISGYPDDPNEKSDLQGEGVDIIVKPVAPEDLLTRVRRLLDQ